MPVFDTFCYEVFMTIMEEELDVVHSKNRGERLFFTKITVTFSIGVMVLWPEQLIRGMSVAKKDKKMFMNHPAVV